MEITFFPRPSAYNEYLQLTEIKEKSVSNDPKYNWDWPPRTYRC